jgi:hypothetical protein
MTKQACPASFARPKSSTLARPSSVTMTFLGLDVTMHDPGAVGGRQRVGNLGSE